MNAERRCFLATAASAAVLTLAQGARAQVYPSRPVRLVVGFAAGSTTDILARLIGPWLSERLGQQFINENRPGAGANIATEAVAKAAADGYTLLMIAPVHPINPTLYSKLNYNFERDIQTVAGIVRVPNVLEVHPAVPVKTVPELIAAGVNIVHVPYHGDGPAMTDLIGGQVQVGFATMTASIGHIRSGRLRPLAVATATRSDALPELPTVADYVPGYEASSLFGVAFRRRPPPRLLRRSIARSMPDLQIRPSEAD